MGEQVVPRGGGRRRTDAGSSNDGGRRVARGGGWGARSPAAADGLQRAEISARDPAVGHRAAGSRREESLCHGGAALGEFEAVPGAETTAAPRRRYLSIRRGVGEARWLTDARVWAPVCHLMLAVDVGFCEFSQYADFSSDRFFVATAFSCSRTTILRRSSHYVEGRATKCVSYGSWLSP